MAEPENSDVAAIFAELADLYTIKGGHRYRARALRRVGKIIENLSEPVSVAMAFGRLQQRRGIGEGALIRIKEILRTGTCHDQVQLRKQMSPRVRELLQIDGVGPKTVRTLHAHLGISSIEQLEHAARSGQLAAKLPRFGARAEDRILRAIADYRDRRKGGTPLAEALAIGGDLVAAMCEMKEVVRADLAGSARRRREMVGDLDLLVASYEPLKVSSRFVQLPQVKDVRMRGDTRSSVRLHSGQQVDLRVLVPETYGAGLHYFTGSQRHNILIRARGNRRGLKISEYGIFIRQGEVRLAGARESDVFAAVGLPFIPPELREADGEIEAAERGKLPRLLEQRDVQGDLRLRIDPGCDPSLVAALIERASELGLRYVALAGRFTGASEGDLLEGVAALSRLRDGLGGASAARLLVGVEIDIQPDGSLSVDPTVLEPLDWVIASVHTELKQDRSAMTRRMVRAIETGVVDCIGHPLNRLLGQRDQVALDLGAVLAAAARCGVALELNAEPARLDLSAAACRQAREARVLVAIGSGASMPDQLQQLQLGTFTARRGWLEARDVLNSRPAAAIAAWRAERLERMRGSSGGLAAATVNRAKAYLAEVAALQRSLEAGPPLPADLRARVEAWLQGGDDQQLSTALGALGDNPLRRAYELVVSSAADDD